MRKNKSGIKGIKPIPFWTWVTEFAEQALRATLSISRGNTPYWRIGGDYDGGWTPSIYGRTKKYFRERWWKAGYSWWGFVKR